MQEQFELSEVVGPWFQKHIKLILAAAGLVLFGAASYFVIDYKRSTYRQGAYDFFVDIKKLVDAPVVDKDDDSEQESHELKFSTEAEKWTKVRETAKKGFEKYGQHGFGANFPMYEVNALLKLGRNEEAMEVLAKTVKNLSRGPIKDLMEAKLALIKMDSASADVKSEGLAELDKIANSGGCASDMAYFRLGEYHWARGNTNEARSVWNSLVTEFSTKNPKHPDMDDVLPEETMVTSPWAEKAREKLRLIQ